MSNVTLVLDSYDVLTNISVSQAAEHYGADILDYFHLNDLLLAAGGVEEILSDATDDQIDSEFLARHPNPSEMLDYLDDESIIDYLINKGYNIEM